MKKLTIIGGGSVRAPFFANSLAKRAHTLHISTLCLYDIDSEKLRVIGSIAKHAVAKIAPDLQVILETDLTKAITGTDYFVTTIRVGGDHSRVVDEQIAIKNGVLGQETTGAAGFSFAMRSVPALAEYCELAKKVAHPNVKIFNFTNPAGVVSQALRDMGYDFTYGICDAPTGMLREFAALYGADSSRITGECYGLNHLSFFHSVKLDGKEIMPELLSREDARTQTDLRYFEPDLLKHMGCVLNEYLYYFYYREKAVENILKAGVTRGEVIQDINRHMTAELSTMDIEHDFDACLACFEKWYDKRDSSYMANETGARRTTPWSFDLTSPDAGGYAGVALRFIELTERGETGDMVLCVPNNGALAGLEDSDVIETTCTISAGTCTPHPTPNPDPRAMELIRRVKSYERLASKAIVERDRQAAVDCLMLHPLVNSYSLAKEIAEEYIAHNAAYIDGWH